MRKLLAFVITSVIYGLLFWLYFRTLKELPTQYPTSKEHLIKIDLKQFETPSSVKRVQKTKPTPLKDKRKHLPQKIKPKVKKALPKVQNRKKEHQKKHHTKDVKKSKVLPKKEKQITKESTQKILQPSEMIYIEEPLLLGSSAVSAQTSSKVSPNHYPSRTIKKLYGERFWEFSSTQQAFIQDNLDLIHQITQETLSRRGYPAGALAARTGQEGTNVVAFKLHPNGDISDLHLIGRTGYRILDENTLETIRIAYKDYPYPDEITPIIFYVEYSIFGY